MTAAIIAETKKIENVKNTSIIIHVAERSFGFPHQSFRN
jgi:hypothetical protein